jgi:NTE family protein
MPLDTGSYGRDMAASITTRPDVLVLGAGGTLGIAWLQGVLAGLEEAAGFDLRECDYFLGTSAGSVVASALAAGHRPAENLEPPRTADAAAAPPDDDEDGGEPSRSKVRGAVRAAAGVTTAVTAPLMPLALTATAPAGAVVRRTLLKVGPTPKRSPEALRGFLASMNARFDGRLRVATVDRQSGKRVVFGAPGAPAAEVADAVMASCAVPWLFRPERIGDREYVDGGLWSLTNLDAAPARRGAEVLCLVPTGSPRLAKSPFGALRLATHAGLLAELQVLRARGVRVRVVTPDEAAGEAMGPNLMNARRRAGTVDAARRQGRLLAA